jgi:hypothetical protein
MKHALIATSILAPWVIGLLAVSRFSGWDILGRSEIRSQADRLRAFGAR